MAMTSSPRAGFTSMLDTTRYPEQPLVYQRPFLRTIYAAFCWAVSALALALVLLPDTDMTGSDWWIPFGMGALFGGGYQYITARLVVDSTHAHIRNATVVVSVPLGHIVDVEPGADLVLVAA
jgi:hypothetical protein